MFVANEWDTDVHIDEVFGMRGGIEAEERTKRSEERNRF